LTIFLTFLFSLILFFPLPPQPRSGPVNHRCKLLSVRLVGGSSRQGRLDVLHNGIWGTVCNDFFDDAAAAVVCNMLGFG